MHRRDGDAAPQLLPLRLLIGITLLAACGHVGPSARDGVIFESTWATATGTSKEALTDGGRWPNYLEFHNDPAVQLLSVVPGGVDGQNALRVQQRGPGYSAFLQIDNVVPQSRDYYVRFYMKNDDTSGTADHIVTVDMRNYGNLTFMRKVSDASSWRFVVSMHGCGAAYPLVHWGPPGRLAHGEWYRFEYFVHYTDSRHIQVTPRVYDSGGMLLFAAPDFQQEGYKRGGNWSGRDDWTLASYYDAGHSFCTNPTWMNDFGLGNNGQREATDTGRYWYFSAVQIRTDAWPGPALSGARP